MRLPTGTYRLQLREGIDFDRARALVPHIADLGASHLYLSPIFTAQPGSTHGYDVTDPGEVDPVLGGMDGFERLAAECEDAGLGLIIDIVPNHTAFGLDNPWLRDVLRHGQASRYARHFDIDWAAGRLRLPWLDEPFDPAKATIDGDVMQVGDLAVPIAPANGDVAAVHDAQAWRLTDWRTEHGAITHRRFFAVTGLIGMRIEDDAVYRDMHALTFDLIRRGLVQGLRVDHVDGPADPAAYLRRLRADLPDVPIWIEKILTDDETLPADWPVEGETGYHAARSIARVLTDPEGEAILKDAFDRDLGATLDFVAVRDEAKRQIVTTELTAELRQLTGMFRDAVPGTEWGYEDLRAAIVAYVCAFPRYRSYATADHVSDRDATLIRDTAARAAAGRPMPGALPLLADALCGPEGARLRVRIQQVTGAAIAKAQEDTAFFRYVPYLAANEVGSEPDHPAMEVAAFHDAMAARARAMPHALTLTSSHDTKRSEDARARITILSHQPDLRDRLLREVPEDLPPAWRWYLAQSAWALAGEPDAAPRLRDHMIKAMREAKQDTVWPAPNGAFEEPILAAADAVGARFATIPVDLQEAADRADHVTIAQTALKLTVPGIPDIYQGTEVASRTLTDPDNRRAVGFDDLLAGGGTGVDAVKLSLTRTVLRLRRERPEAFLNGGYDPIAVPAGRLGFVRGDAMRVTVSLDGSPLDGGGTIWPPSAMGPQAAALDWSE
ncbi:malto-oligosyltrehalose synthase [Jannaschia sp. LMIT008]|uniref:malto-oligosyltrehalose synthase n=1 Tax=Jannaschia maritima TaxID=3032585 RepID=UPI0028125956|nr:malto-oligosyltrehalose synthase [Jannaschia sp. LMIT008]